MATGKREQGKDEAKQALRERVFGFQEKHKKLTTKDVVAQVATDHYWESLMLIVKPLWDTQDPDSIEFADALSELACIMVGSFRSDPNSTMAEMVRWLAKESRRKKTAMFADACFGIDQMLERIPFDASEASRAVYLSECGAVALLLNALDPGSSLLTPERVLAELNRPNVRLETRIGNLARTANALECGGKSSEQASDRFRRALKTAKQEK